MANGPVIAATGETPTGAVLVVGGGIAGMQASLDLADQGYKVYLVEKNSAIGGHMAQLDKTFPTNDCAMCTISPRLVDVGRHLNIELLTDSEVETVAGQPGAFSATVRTKPRYIDLERCNGCGECAEVCPVAVSNDFNEGLNQRRAAYKLYPQATPTGFAIEKRGRAPCREACPTGQRAQGYIALVAAGRFDEAYRTIKEDNPFPAICGRVCNAPCEDACSRGRVDAPVAIRALKRFVSDRALAAERQPVAPAERRHEERIAIIGAGPCGLTAAQDLCRAGYGVTVYDALPVAGGMLRTGVPEYRLPADVIEREIQDILDLGVELKLNTPVGDLDDLFAAGHDAVLIAVGAQEGIRLPLAGNDLEGALINTDFLRQARLDDAAAAAQVAGKRVTVLGGGDVACDVARTALRFGASQVDMVCLEADDALPASQHELSETLAEGVVLHASRNPLRLVDDGSGYVAGLECQHINGFDFDAEGRLQVTAIVNSQHTIDCEVMIFSVGQRVAPGFTVGEEGQGFTPRRTIAVDAESCRTERPGVFAAGDATTGTTFIVDAVAHGHRAAAAIGRHLRGEDSELPRSLVPVAEISDHELESRRNQGEIVATPQVPVPAMAAEERRQSFAEVESVYCETEALAEAARCLDCGICSECLACDFACGVDAVAHEMVEQERQIEVGAVVLAPGYQTYRAELSEEFGFGRFPNVITSLQHERLLSASGPTNGHVQRPSDSQTPKKIAFLQCVGSRDQGHDYCSAVCCMYAAKQAIMAKEHEPATEVRVFMMDMRSFSKGYEGYYQRAKEKYDVGYTRCRISGLKERPESKNLMVRYLDDDGGGMIEEEFDLVVLSVGMEVSQGVRDLGQRLGVELDDYGFCQTVHFDPLQTSRPGIYAVGPFREPKDIPDSLVEASGAAAQVGGLLAAGRHTLTQAENFPPERDVSEEEARTAVFVCHCGTNIAGFLDVDAVSGYAGSLPGVVHTEHTMYACSQDNIAQISETVRQTGANRVVIAACTPLTHEPLFQSSLRAAGLNPYLVDMANIRNQCSWVHSHDWDRATHKAKDLVRMSTARAAALRPLGTAEMPVEKAALVVGGGPAGMTAALTLAEQGFPVNLVERGETLGGNLRHLHFGLQEFGIGGGLGNGNSPATPRQLLADLEERLDANPLVNVHLNSEVVDSSGFMGNFSATVRNASGGDTDIRHGVVVVATGGQEYRGEEYGYGSRPDIVTQQEFEARLAGDQEPPQSVVMIQCVGPAEKYCGRICCTSALKNALVLKQRNPESRITILYKDIRTYGFKERLYTQAREAGILFVRYDDDHVPEVEAGERLTVRAYEPVLGRDLDLPPDLLVLSTPVVPPQAARDLAARLKVSFDMDGFFMEAHAKMRPMDFLSEGIFMAGMAHYPKLLEEAIVHARAAASRAATVLSRDTITTGGAVAAVDQEICVACLTCVRSCPFGAPRIAEDLSGVGNIAGAANIESALCQGCGLCVAACPAGAIDLRHFTNSQVMAKIDAMFAPTGTTGRLSEDQPELVS